MSMNLLKIASVLALSGAAALPLQVQAQTQEAQPAAENAVVARDAVTGKLRAATEAEQAQLNSIKSERNRRFRGAAGEPVQKYHKNGVTRGARLTEEFVSTSVAVLNKDGKVEQECFDNPEAASTALSNGSIHSHTHTQSATE